MPSTSARLARSHCNDSTGVRRRSSSTRSFASAKIPAIHSSGHSLNADCDSSSCLAKVVLPEPGSPQMRKRVGMDLLGFFDQKYVALNDHGQQTEDTDGDDYIERKESQFGEYLRRARQVEHSQDGQLMGVDRIQIFHDHRAL